MRVFMTKASDPCWFEFKICDKILDLYSEIGSFIVQPNVYVGSKPGDIRNNWNCWEDENMTLEEAEVVSKCDLNIIIYDDCIE